MKTLLAKIRVFFNFVATEIDRSHNPVGLRDPKFHQVFHRGRRRRSKQRSHPALTPPTRSIINR